MPLSFPVLLEKTNHRYPSQIPLQPDAVEEDDDIDPFAPCEDAFFKQEPSSLGSVFTVLDSPVTSSGSNSARPRSISISSSYSSSASSGHTVLRTSSRNLTRAEGFALFTRTLEVLRLSKDLRVIAQAICTLRNLLSAKQVTYTQFLIDGVLQPVCQLLRMHCSNASLTEECCRLLARLCERSVEARRIVLDVNGVRLLQMVMEAHFELYPSTADAAMRALSELCPEGQVVRVLMLQTRALEWVMVCVRQWRETRVLQNTALQCLQRAVVNESADRHHIVSLGVFQEILRIMRHFEDDCVVNYRCIKLCSVIIEQNEEYTKMSSAEGIVERMICAMRLFPHKLEIVAAGSKVCQYFCSYSYCRGVFIEESGVNSLLEAFQETVLRGKDIGSSAHRMATIGCLAALERVSVVDSTHPQLFQIEPIRAIEWTISQYDDDARVSEIASMLLRTLALRESERAHRTKLFVKTKPQTSILEQVSRIATKILSMHSGNPRVAENVCRMLCNQCSHGHVLMLKKSCPDLLQVVQQVVKEQSPVDEVVNIAVSLALRIK